jgi:arginyl-tRNA--protein-N-Asp/Glu arginylyltransferase
MGTRRRGGPQTWEGILACCSRIPFPTEEWTYYVGHRLIAVAYVDALPEALSAIYCYYDPTEAARSPGTFN